MTRLEEKAVTASTHRRERGQGVSLALLLWLCLLGPAFAAAADGLRVAVISDLNGSYGSTDYEASVDGAVERILALRPDLVISTGDMVAGQRKPHLSREEIEWMWEAFHESVSDPLATAGIPLAVTPGNHDGSAYQGFAHEREIYGEQWVRRVPALRFVDKAEYPFHYAFAAGDVLFVSLDATTVGHLPPAQMDWLEALLDRHGGDYRRRVVFSHVPLWPFAHGRETEFIGDPGLQSLLAEAGIDLYLSGHHHAFYPGTKDGVTFVSQSCLGAAPRRLIGTGKKSPRSFTWLEFTDSAVRIAAYKAPEFEAAIDWATLPRRISTDRAELVRADLVEGVVTPLAALAGRQEDTP